MIATSTPTTTGPRGPNAPVRGVAERGRSVGRPVRRRGGVGIADPDVRCGRFGGRPW